MCVFGLFKYLFNLLLSLLGDKVFISLAPVSVKLAYMSREKKRFSAEKAERLKKGAERLKNFNLVCDARRFYDQSTPVPRPLGADFCIGSSCSPGSGDQRTGEFYRVGSAFGIPALASSKLVAGISDFQLCSFHY